MTSMGNAFRSRPRWRQRPRSRAFTSGAASSAMYSSTPPASHTGNVSRHGVPLATDTATSMPIQLLQLLGKPPIVPTPPWIQRGSMRSEEHTSELQSRLHLVCRLLLEKKKSLILRNQCLDLRN